VLLASGVGPKPLLQMAGLATGTDWFNLAASRAKAADPLPRRNQRLGKYGQRRLLSPVAKGQVLADKSEQLRG